MSFSTFYYYELIRKETGKLLSLTPPTNSVKHRKCKVPYIISGVGPILTC
uniref:Uncharacterized protein n=1 Tax=Arundo donax TaxID=35708 RepID=A0A0A9AFR2_ARUDO